MEFDFPSKESQEAEIQRYMKLIERKELPYLKSYGAELETFISNLENQYRIVRAKTTEANPYLQKLQPSLDIVEDFLDIIEDHLLPRYKELLAYINMLTDFV